MGKMFGVCSKIKSIDLSNFNTFNLINIRDMFYGCTSLESINLSNFDTSKVTDMANIFKGCNSLKSIDISNFNTSKVTNMGYIFYECSSLESIDISNFNTSKVTDMGYMLYKCSSLESIDLSNFDMINCHSYNNIFSDINNIKYLNLYNFKNDKLISNIFNNTNNSIFICQKNKIINNQKAYNCCDSNLKNYECAFSNTPSKDDNSNNNTSSISIEVIIDIIVGGALVIITIIIIIYCSFKIRHELRNNVEPKKEKNSSLRVYSEKPKKIDSTSSRNNNFTPTSNSPITIKYKSPIFEHEPYNEKDNPIIIIFQNPRFGDSNKTIDELIKFYFEIIERKDLYGDENISFLIRSNLIIPPYPKESIETLKNNINKSGAIRIIVVYNNKG